MADCSLCELPLGEEEPKYRWDGDNDSLGPMHEGCRDMVQRACPHLRSSGRWTKLSQRRLEAAIAEAEGGDNPFDYDPSTEGSSEDIDGTEKTSTLRRLSENESCPQCGYYCHSGNCANCGFRFPHPASQHETSGRERLHEIVNEMRREPRSIHSARKLIAESTREVLNNETQILEHLASLHAFQEHQLNGRDLMELHERDHAKTGGAMSKLDEFMNSLSPTIEENTADAGTFANDPEFQEMLERERQQRSRKPHTHSANSMKTKLTHTREFI